MAEALQDPVEDNDSGDNLEVTDDDDHNPLPVGWDTTEVKDANAPAQASPTCLDKARVMYSPLGAPRKVIRLMANIHEVLDALKLEQCMAPAHRSPTQLKLSVCVDAVLSELVVGPPTEIHQVAPLALEVRALVPELFDRWVNLQFSIGKPLAMVSAKRNACDLPRERLIEEGLARGRLLAGAVTSTQDQFERFVAIARLTLEANLNITTVDEQLELDTALSDLLTAKRISALAQCYISPAGARAVDLAQGLKLLGQAKSFKTGFQRTIDRMRVRSRRRSRVVQPAAKKKRITLAPDGGTQARKVTTPDSTEATQHTA